MVVNGILSSSGKYTNSYAKEELTVALNRIPAPQGQHTQEERLSFDTDVSFAREIDEVITCISYNEPIHTGTIDDASQLMIIIEKIYRDD